MPAKELQPLSVLRNRVVYDHITGIIHLRNRSRPPKPNTQGYICFRINGQYMAAHRIAWALHHGSLPNPDMEIDHINGVRHDNRMCNLRLVTQGQNLRNKKNYKNSSHGYPGILHEKDGRERCWRAQISINKKLIKGGAFRCKTAAIFARKRLEKKYGFTARNGEKKWQL